MVQARSNVSASWKVPFRGVYCFTFASWLRQTFWCHVVIRVFPFARDLGSDALLDHYIEGDPRSFFEQYEQTLRDARAARLARV